MEIVKICKVHGELTLDDVKSIKSGKNIKPRIVCKVCKKINDKKYNEKNKEKYREIKRKYVNENREKIKIKREEFFRKCLNNGINKIEEYRKRSSEKFKKKRSDLKDKFRVCLGHENEVDIKNREKVLVSVSLCLICKRSHQIKYMKNNPERYKKVVRKSLNKFLEENGITKSKHYRMSNIEKFRKKASLRRKNAIKNLGNEYIKKLIIGRSEIKHSEIPKEMVLAKRELIKLKRHLRSKTNVNNNDG